MILPPKNVLHSIPTPHAWQAFSKKQRAMPMPLAHQQAVLRQFALKKANGSADITDTALVGARGGYCHSWVSPPDSMVRESSATLVSAAMHFQYVSPAHRHEGQDQEILVASPAVHQSPLAKSAALVWQNT